MEHVYQQRVETSMNRALPDIAYYMLTGLLVGSLLEYIMPKFTEEKDSVALFLEIFAQIAIIVFAFMFIHSKGGGRNGVIVFVLIVVGCQPTLFEKINRFRELIFGISKVSSPVVKEEQFHLQQEEEVTEEEQDDETENVEANGATPLSMLPSM